MVQYQNNINKLELESKVRYIKILLTDIYQVTVFFSAS